VRGFDNVNTGTSVKMDAYRMSSSIRPARLCSSIYFRRSTYAYACTRAAGYVPLRARQVVTDRTRATRGPLSLSLVRGGRGQESHARGSMSAGRRSSFVIFASVQSSAQYVPQVSPQRARVCAKLPTFLLLDSSPRSSSWFPS
jgi:hypothetical protein